MNLLVQKIPTAGFMTRSMKYRYVCPIAVLLKYRPMALILAMLLLTTDDVVIMVNKCGKFQPARHLAFYQISLASRDFDQHQDICDYI